MLVISFFTSLFTSYYGTCASILCVIYISCMRFAFAWGITFVLLVMYSGFAGSVIGGDLIADLLPDGSPSSVAWFNSLSTLMWLYFAFISLVYAGFFRLLHLSGSTKAVGYCLMLWSVSSVPDLLLAFSRGAIDRMFVLTHLGGQFAFFLVLAVLFSIIWKPRLHL
jgi:hypothetical protein